MPNTAGGREELRQAARSVQCFFRPPSATHLTCFTGLISLIFFKSSFVEITMTPSIYA